MLSIPKNPELHAIVGLDAAATRLLNSTDAPVRLALNRNMDGRLTFDALVAEGPQIIRVGQATAMEAVASAEKELNARRDEAERTRRLVENHFVKS